MKGPQSFPDRTNETLLHYYGKGWYKWYRMTEFKKQMEIMFQNDAPVRTLELFGHKPNTDNISWKQYEQLLRMTNEAINHDCKQNKIWLMGQVSGNW